MTLLLSALRCSSLPQPRWRLTLGAFITILTLTFIWQQLSLSPGRAIPKDGGLATSRLYNQTRPPLTGTLILDSLLLSILSTSEYFINYPLPPSEFGQMGKRLQILQSWIEASEKSQLSSEQLEFLHDRIDRTANSLFPFLPGPKNSSISYLRRHFKSGSRGIVIPTGLDTFRYTCHLIGNIRQVLSSKLPVEIAFAGDEDLPPSHRDFITSLGPDITTLDVTKIFEVQIPGDAALNLTHSGWAIKSFATLASKFSQIIMLDADAVLLQPPETIFDQHTGYRDTGALLFHDRLLWQGEYKERHEWWEKHLEHQAPSAALSKSLVYNEGYAEECDAGLVAMDKSRLSILLGLLHICWQNTKPVREAFTYTIGYGDKESWWFGLELTGAEYAFEGHYASILGSAEGDKVCSFTIAHVDQRDRLLWYNGSLLKNKMMNATDFLVPSHWMLDGVWEKGDTKPDMSCMNGTTIREMTEDERRILAKSVEWAREVDERIETLISKDTVQAT